MAIAERCVGMGLKAACLLRGGNRTKKKVIAQVKVVVAQKGAREHFLAARALARQTALAKLVVDWYAPANPLLRRALCLLGHRHSAALGARSEEIPDSLVISNPISGLIGKWKQSIRPRRGSPYDTALQVDTAFTKAAACCKLPDHDAIFAYSYMSLELFEAARKRGVLTILDQIDPGPAEFRLVAEEMQNHPEIAGLPHPFPTAYYDRLRKEWKLADVIVVNSEWTRDAIVAEGADSSKIEILPLAYEPPSGPITPSSDLRTLTSGTLKVLWLGQVNVRKGIHYLLQAARLLESRPFEFLIGGPLHIRQEVVTASPPNVRWLGLVPRGKAPELYARCDVFVLPTLSDGFAITQIEALAHGLPLVVTPNCARVVQECQTGFTVSARDPDALSAALVKFIEHRALSREMAPRCRSAATRYSVAAYGKRLVEIIEKHKKLRGK